MKKWVVAIAMGGLIISFQNCSKSNLGSTGSLDASSQENPAVTAPVSEYSPSKAVAIEVPNSPLLDENIEAVSSKAGSSFNSYSLILNPQTGVINVLLATGDIDSSKQFCLSSAQIAELEDLLANAKLYEGQDTTQSDQACTMDYRFPYAKLHFTDKEVSLGEKFSGCHTGADLEKSSSLKLKNFLSGVITNLSSAKCSFEEVQ